MPHALHSAEVLPGYDFLRPCHSVAVTPARFVHCTTTGYRRAGAEAYEGTDTCPEGRGRGAGFPDTIAIELNQPVLLTSVAAADVMVEGQGASSVTVLDGTHLVFDVAALNQGDGSYNVTIADGALTSVGGAPVQALGFTFNADATYPTVVASTLTGGEEWSDRPYTLLVVRNAALDVETNDSIEQAQLLEHTVSAIGYLSSAPGDVEPDDYAEDDDLTSVVAGVTLTVEGTTETVTAQAVSFASTGSQVFGHGSNTAWDSDDRWPACLRRASRSGSAACRPVP